MTGSQAEDRRQVTLHDDFLTDTLDDRVWIAEYLPQWTTPDRSRARYRTGDGLTLLIEHDQPAWRLEDGEMRVSNLQTGAVSGPRGSSIGQHRHRPDLPVRTPVGRRVLWSASSGRVRIDAAASRTPRAMLGLWLVGVEDEPQQSGELCIAEVFGHAVGTATSTVRLGVKAHHDPRLTDEVVDVPIAADASELLSYEVEWDATGARFAVAGQVVHTTTQVLDYPLQLMVDLFEFPDGGVRDPGDYPIRARVGRVQAWSP